MAFQRGFKTWANTIAADARAELGLSLTARLDPIVLAESLDIPVIPLSEFAAVAPEVEYLIDGEPEVFSAMTVFAGRRRLIVHNDGHTPARQNSNIGHELSHGLLAHPPTPALDDAGCRIWNQDIEDEAGWLSGCLLIPEPAALAIARGRWTVEGAAVHFGVSTAMVTFRLNATGARKRAARERSRRAA
ncbi:Zn-dependent peptidase ImmA (M78 family) [Microbacterium sp. AK009]|uniref:ImmA/IrrE family metallo-endopeptidase n=1 Tax=Microbacterium sp. AK009 TaxID=2723068 RepID=UPI0015C9C253|nr:ImmA/IrrE family metallo-endopeptidase [Microbacterium sp. AK009]NYF16560.1 Zn-dependent peptidase ImmA (M78 family) [Microbacterium sp. AK009]